MKSPTNTNRTLWIVVLLFGFGFGTPLITFADDVAGPFLSHTEDFTTTTHADLVYTSAVWDSLAGNAHMPPQEMSLTGSFAGTAAQILVGGDRAFVRSPASIAIIGLQELTSPVSQGAITADLLVELTAMAWTGKYLVVCSTRTVTLLPPTYRHFLTVYNVSDPTSPTVRGSVELPNRCLDVETDGTIAAVCYGTAGIGLVDLSIISFPSVAGAHETAGNAADATLWGRYLYVADGANGLVTFDVGDPNLPGIVSTNGAVSPAMAVARDGSRLAVAGDAAGVHLLSARVPQSPQLLGSVVTGAAAKSVAIDGNWVYAGEGDGAIEEIDITTPYSGTIVERFGTGGATVKGLALAGRHLHAALDLSGYAVYEVATPFRTGFLLRGEVTQVSRSVLSTRTAAGGVSICGPVLYACDGELHILDITDPGNPLPLANYPGLTEDAIFDVATGPGTAFVGDLGQVHVLDVRIPSAPQVLTSIALGQDTVVDLELAGNRLVVALEDSVKYYDVRDPASPVLTGSWGPSQVIPRKITDLNSEGSIVWITDDLDQAWYLDTGNPGSSLPSASLYGIHADYSGNRYVATHNSSVSIFDATDLTGLVFLDSYYLPSPDNAEIVSSGSDVLVSRGDGALKYFVTDEPGDPLYFQSTYEPNPGGSNHGGGIVVAGDFVFRTHVDSTLADGCALEVLQLRSRAVDERARRVASTGISVHHQYLDGALRITADCVGAADWYLTTADSGQPAANPDFMPVIADGQWRFFPNLGHESWQWGWAADLRPSSAREPRIDQVQLDVLYYGPVLVAASDVPDDEGGFVDLRWVQSALEVVSIYDVTDYYVVRSANSLAVWDTVAVVPAQGLYEYSVTVPTLGDSIVEPAAAGLNVFTDYQVHARSTAGLTYTCMNLATIQSVDQLAPLPPADLAVHYGPAGGNNTLSWSPSPAPDLLRYRIYRSSDPGFVPSASSLVDSTTAAGWTDPVESHPGVYYAVTAVDDAWQVSDVTDPSTISDVPGTPRHFALIGNRPNPFNPRTVIAFELPSRGPVNLRVFDLSGRLVRVLVDGEILPEGRGEAVWNGRDDAGRRVSSGSYFCRLEAGEHSETRRMALIK